MRRWIWIVGVLVVIGLTYWAWPLVSAVQIARAAQAGNSADVIDRVDLPALRRSLARQIAAAYLDTSGKGQKMGAFGKSMAGAAVTTVADPYLAELLTPENITALLSQGRINKVSVDGRAVVVNGALPQLPNAINSDTVSIVTSSYFDELTDFIIPVNGGQGPDDQYGVHMRLDGLTWKLGGLDLPISVVTGMARSIMAGEKPATP